MKLRIDAEAEAELEDAAAWYEAQRTGLGYELLAAVDEGIQRIRQSPEQFARVEFATPNESTRRMLLRRFPYSLIYEIVADEIHILAVAHVRRRPGYWKTRRP